MLLRLSKKDFNLGELISKVEVEFSEERKCKEYSIDESAIRAGLAQLENEYSKVCNKFNSQNLEREKGEILCGINNAKELLQKSVGGKINKEVKKMGEFISSPKPTVVLYYNNIKDASPDVSGLVPVFVHEMFHAWNYFEAGEEKRAVMEIDEAMVEFATMHFLNTLAESLKQKSDMEGAELIYKCAEWHKEDVEEKKKAVGSTAAYGFGLYLYENSKKASRWIETYANMSATLDSDDSNVAEVMTSLAPFYPFNNEDNVYNQLKDVLFPSKATIAKNRLNNLYKEMERLRSEALSLEKQVNELEEDIIKEEILPCITETIAPALKQMQRELVLVVDYIPGEPISVHISRKRNFIEQITDTKKIVLKEVQHKTKRGANRSLKVTWPDGKIIPQYECSAAETFRDVVLEIGVGAVRKVADEHDLKCNGVPIISDQLDPNYGKAQKDLGGGWWLMTNNSTEQKGEFIKKVSDILDLGLTVEVV